jgi:tRNA (cmo5U34)-methyltransferase
MANESGWSESNSRQFIGVGQFLVPDREQQIELIRDLIPPNPDAVHILDLCCGEGLLAEAILERSSLWIVHGLDGSPEMLDNAAQGLARFGERFQPQAFDLAATEWRKMALPIHAVVSSLAIHHLDGPQKQALFSDIYSLLLPGGIFLIADVVRPATQDAVSAAARIWDESVRQRSMNLSGDLQGWEQFKRDQWNLFQFPNAMDKPSGLFEQLKWLEQAGFDPVDVFWLKAGHAIFGGQKPK